MLTIVTAATIAAQLGAVQRPAMSDSIRTDAVIETLSAVEINLRFDDGLTCGASVTISNFLATSLTAGVHARSQQVAALSCTFTAQF